MPDTQINNINIISKRILPPPVEIKDNLPTTEEHTQRLTSFRRQICDILDGRDNRVFVIAGPCSIHNEEGGYEYGKRLKSLADEISDSVFLIMRVYFEKPRTSTGWKGLINDPGLDGSFRIDDGLKLARRLLLGLNELGIPTATEALDPFVPQYIGDLISWTAIGARTVESQTHREMASGLSTPVGFKNSTSGDLSTAINALKAVSNPHHFLGITQEGECAIFHTRGNPYSHLVLRGGRDGPNYQSEAVNACLTEQTHANVPQTIVIDCSHSNSQKDPQNQPIVLKNGVDQIVNHQTDEIKGFMLESNLQGGKQKIPEEVSELAPDVSITDPCISWEETASCLREIAETLRKNGRIKSH